MWRLYLSVSIFQVLQGQDSNVVSLYPYRGQMQIAAALGGMAVSNGQSGMIHALAHTVGSKYGIPHGITIAILLPHCR